MKPTVYLETTIPSYLTAWPSRDLVRAGHQHITREWWARRAVYDLRVSQLVVQECMAGDRDAAAERLKSLEGIVILPQSGEADDLTIRLVREVKLPPAAQADAAHMAIAAVSSVEFLVTWNCRHMANIVLRPRIERVCADAGFKCPIICTPEQLLEAGL